MGRIYKLLALFGAPYNTATQKTARHIVLCGKIKHEQSKGKKSRFAFSFDVRETMVTVTVTVQSNKKETMSNK